YARRSQPGQFTEAVNRSDSQDVQRDGPSEEQMFVIPGVNRLTASANVLGGLQGELKHSHVRSDGGQVNVESIQNAARRRLQIVQSLAHGRISDRHGGRIARQRAEPHQLVSAYFN